MWGCSSPQPETTGFRALTQAEVLTSLSTQPLQQPLTAEGTNVLGAYTGYVTFKFEGVAAPIDVMKTQCPEKVLSADTTPLYGLEAPYDVNLTASEADSVVSKDISDVTTETNTKYTGDYVVLAKEQIVISVFPDGVATIADADGTEKVSAKLLRGLTASATATPWQAIDTNGREWNGVEISTSLRTPAKPEATSIKDELQQTWLLNPCQ